MLPTGLPFIVALTGFIASIALGNAGGALLGWLTFILFVWFTWVSDRPRRRLVRARAEVDARLAGLRSALPHFQPARDE